MDFIPTYVVMKMELSTQRSAACGSILWMLSKAVYVFVISIPALEMRILSFKQTQGVVPQLEANNLSQQGTFTCATENLQR